MRQGTFLLLVILAVMPAELLAQDTTGREQQSGTYISRYTFYNGDVSTQPLSDINNYARLEAGYLNTSGSYRLAQAAPRQQDIYFNTAGTRQLGKYRLSGYFGYTHTLQDSVGYTLRYGLPDPDPYYFYAYKRGNWQVGQYRLQAIASRAFFNNKLLAGAGVQYNTVNAWRSNDPRPEQFNYETRLEASLHYRFLPKHSLGISGGLINRKKETSIQYRNKDYQLSLAYPEYVKRMQYGYGFEDRASNSGIKASGDGYTWQAVYQWRSPVGIITARGGYTYAESNFKGDSSRYFPKGRYGSFYEDIWKAAVNWQWRKKNHGYALNASYINHLGRDLNEFLKVNNYVYSYEELRVQPIYTHFKDSVVQYEIGLDVSMADLFRADGNASVLTDYQYSNVALNAAYYFPVDKQSWLRAGVQAGMRTPVSPVLQLPSQLSQFVQQVIAPDYYYYAARVFTGGMHVLYSRNIDGNDAFVRLKALFDQARHDTSELPALSKPGNRRWYWEASIGINLR